MSSSLAVANKFIELAQKENNNSLTNMKLQKLVYIAHGFSLAGTELGALDSALLDQEDIYAWQFGPVIRNLYEHLRAYGRGEVTIPIPSNDQVTDQKHVHLIESIWRSYKHHDGFSLSNITHLPNTPWSQIWNQSPYSVIPLGVIKEHYLQLVRNMQNS